MARRVISWEDVARRAKSQALADFIWDTLGVRDVGQVRRMPDKAWEDLADASGVGALQKDGHNRPASAKTRAMVIGILEERERLASRGWRWGGGPPEAA